MVKIPLNDICYCEAQGNHTSPGRIFKPYLSVSALEEQLPDARFMRVHRSFIISLKKVDSFTNTYVIMQDRKIPIGRSYSPKAKAGLQIKKLIEMA